MFCGHVLKINYFLPCWEIPILTSHISSPVIFFLITLKGSTAKCPAVMLKGTIKEHPCAALVKPRSRRLGGFLLCLRFIIFFFSFVGEQTQTPGPLGQLLSPNDVTISQLQAISQLFSSYPPQEHFVKLAN